MKRGPGRRGATWIAVVGGFGGSGRRVSVGYSGHKRSRRDAERAAIRACTRDGTDVTCRNPFAVSSGCLYIVPGERRSGGMTWGRGGTRRKALSECRSGGYSCPSEKMIGGCVSGYE